MVEGTFGSRSSRTSTMKTSTSRRGLMRNCFILLSLFASVSGCRPTECPPGTVERDGTCEPPNSAVDPGVCGEFTELVGDRCVPTFPPTVCEDGTTEAVTDPDTGVTTCRGTGGLLPCGVP